MPLTKIELCQVLERIAETHDDLDLAHSIYKVTGEVRNEVHKELIDSQSQSQSQATTSALHKSLNLTLLNYNKVRVELVQANEDKQALQAKLAQANKDKEAIGQANKGLQAQVVQLKCDVDFYKECHEVQKERVLKLKAEVRSFKVKWSRVSETLDLKLVKDTVCGAFDAHEKSGGLGSLRIQVIKAVRDMYRAHIDNMNAPVDLWTCATCGHTCRVQGLHQHVDCGEYGGSGHVESPNC